ncbi:MAG: glycosyltransferase family 1 protein [Euryarchaeota archaeon]|nr:glycosyltransferase family 1 protein [Euryarchaeota archaeon]
MKPTQTITVVATLPERLQPLQELAHNLCWTWNHEAMDLFQRIDPELWEATGHNPVRMLGVIIQPRLNALARDEGFVAQLERVVRAVDGYMEGETWYDKTHGKPPGPLVAYFSAEFGVTECLPIYSGGLGILAGDHLKSAAEMGIPIVGVGLLYRVGYFHQFLNEDGLQGETFTPNDFYDMPLERVCPSGDRPLLVDVQFPGRTVRAQAWRAQVGRVPLYLLDTDVPENSESDRGLTWQLYGGDSETRIQQEMLLGIGGVRLLKALGLAPTIYHMNEGHSAFLALERAFQFMPEHRLGFMEALELSRAGNVFTTHTPVPAGIDVFPPQLMEKYFRAYADRSGVGWDRFLALGRQDPGNPGEGFSMAVLALHTAATTNGVSRLHARVSRNMWQGVWPGVPPEEIPIMGITNGIHHRSWISKDMAELYIRYLGPRWLGDPSDHTIWQNVQKIPDEELWGTHSRRRERLVAFARRRLKSQLRSRGASPAEVAAAEETLDPRTLTIGFGRRFATYKRSTMIFYNPDRLASILNNRERPVQLIFAGKAHPRDGPGKDMIRRIVQFARKENFRHRLVFLEDYDAAVARYLVQGADVWLNTPRRPLEASGTSGMKAAANGAINLSVLDGWWDEAYRPEAGWAIGRPGEEFPDPNTQDSHEANHLYKIIEEEIAPLFYDVGQDTVPNGWVQKMKSSMASVCPFFNTNRMVRDYLDRMYLPGVRRVEAFSAGGFERCRRLAAWKARLREGWGDLGVDRIQSSPQGELTVGTKVEVRCRVRLGRLAPGDVSVQTYEGRVDPSGHIVEARTVEMEKAHANQDGTLTYAGSFVASEAGQYGFTIRVLPKNEDLTGPFEPGLVFWAV